MTVKRSDEFILVALFLSRYGRKVEGRKRLRLPQLSADSWESSILGVF